MTISTVLQQFLLFTLILRNSSVLVSGFQLFFSFTPNSLTKSRVLQDLAHTAFSSLIQHLYSPQEALHPFHWRPLRSFYWLCSFLQHLSAVSYPPFFSKTLLSSFKAHPYGFSGKLFKTFPTSSNSLLENSEYLVLGPQDTGHIHHLHFGSYR